MRTFSLVSDPDFGPGATRALVPFKNGLEMSVVRHPGSYGWPHLYEAWITYGPDLRGVNLIGVTDYSGIAGWLSIRDIETIAIKVHRLPARNRILRRVRRIVKLRRTRIPHLMELADKIAKRLGVDSSMLDDLN